MKCLASPGDPDAELAVGSGCVGCEMGAAGGNAEEGGGEALDLDEVPGSGDEEVFAVEAVECGEDVAVDGGVYGLLEGGVGVIRGGGVGWRRGEDDLAGGVVDGEGCWPGHAGDCVWVDVAVDAVVWG